MVWSGKKKKLEVAAFALEGDEAATMGSKGILISVSLGPVDLPYKAVGLQWEYLLGNHHLLKSRRGLSTLQDEQVALKYTQVNKAVRMALMSILETNRCIPPALSHGVHVAYFPEKIKQPLISKVTQTFIMIIPEILASCTGD